MNEDRISGNWKQFKGKVQEQWGKLTNDDMDVVEGKREQLAGRIQERYGYTKEQTEQEMKTWEDHNRYKW
ncbi:MAG: CsbD family protein [Leclercia sp.]